MAWAASSFENVAKKLPESVCTVKAFVVRRLALLWLSSGASGGLHCKCSKNQHTKRLRIENLIFGRSLLPCAFLVIPIFLLLRPVLCCFFNEES